MDWKGRRTSSRVEDRRGGTGMGGGFGGGLGGGGGGMGRGPRVGGGIGIGSILLLVLFMIFGGGGSLFNGAVEPGQPGTAVTGSPQEEELKEFVSVVLADTEDVWTEQFRKEGRQYNLPSMVLYRDAVQSACGYSGSSTGPFYCPGDEKIYIDLAFFDELRTQFQAPGDFAMAYVIAHEVGHHVQNELGITDQVMALRSRMGETEFNQYLVRLELQADYLSGVWAHHAQQAGYLEQGDYQEAMNAASAVGDDRLQEQSRGYAVPDSFTHGTSEQRQRWFAKGFQSGTLTGGDTFGEANP